MDFWFYYYAVVVFIFGLIFGSFLNCTAMRLVRGEDFIRGHSHCMECGHELSALDLIPVFSWVFSGGKCRYCKKKISIRYPFTELLLAVLWLGIYIKFGFTVESIRDIILTGCLFTLSIVDIESYEIPDGILIIAFITWAVTAPFIYTTSMPFSIVHHILSGLVCGGIMLAVTLIMDKVLGKESMGGGDIKLFALLGLYLGYLGSYLLVLMSCLVGLLFAVITKNKKIPFGPSIALSGYITLLIGQIIIDWYISLL